MVPVDQLLSLPFFTAMPQWVLEHLASEAVERTLPANEWIVRQHDEATHIFLLCSGSVQFLIRFEGVEDLLVGTSREFGSLIGWSAFRIPYRYTASVRCEGECRIIRLPRVVLDQVIEHDTRFGYLFLKRVASTLANRLEQTRDLLVAPRGRAAKTEATDPAV